MQNKLTLSMMLSTLLFNSGVLLADATPGTTQWSFDIQGPINDAPALGADGTIYANSQDQHLWAINPDGTKKWAFPTIYNPNGSPFVDQQTNTIFITATSIADNIAVLDAITPQGTQQWSMNFSNYSPYNCGLYLPIGPKGNNNGVIFVDFVDVKNCEPLDSVATVNSATGAVIYKSFTLAPAPSSLPPTRKAFYDKSSQSFLMPSMFGNNVNFITQTFTTSAKLIMTPAPDTDHLLSNVGGDGNGRIYIGDTLGNITAYDLLSSKIIWQTALYGDVSHAAPLVGPDGTIYVGSSNGYLFTLLQDGTLKLKPIFIDTAGISREVVLDPDGTIYVTADSGNLYAVDNTGNIKWSRKDINATTTPILGKDGTLYVGTAFNTVVAINGETPSI